MKEPRSIYKSAAGEAAVMSEYDRLLAEWPQSTECLQVQTRHGHTAVLAQGPVDAPVLVLLHGAGANALSWGGDLPEFARHFRVFAVDTPGDPGRSCHTRIPWRGNGIVEWLEDVLDGLGAEHVMLTGISQGGYVGLRFATARPGRVKALALLAPGGVSPANPGLLVRAVAFSALGGWGTKALVRYVMGDGGVPDEAMAYMDLIFTHYRPRVDALPLLTDAELRGLSMPVLLMAGAEDAIFDAVKMVDRIVRLVDGVDARLLPDAGHALINVAPTITPFLMGASGLGSR